MPLLLSLLGLNSYCPFLDCLVFVAIVFPKLRLHAHTLIAWRYPHIPDDEIKRYGGGVFSLVWMDPVGFVSCLGLVILSYAGCVPLLGSSCFIFMGRLWYGLYCYHWPIQLYTMGLLHRWLGHLPWNATWTYVGWDGTLELMPWGFCWFVSSSILIVVSALMSLRFERNIENMLLAKLWKGI